MGCSRWNAADYSHYSRTVSKKTQKEIFTQRAGHKDLDPSRFDVRESCDSPENPNSTPVIIGVDETGSMGVLAETIIKKGLGVIVQGIYERKPIPDPHVLLAAIGDMYYDYSPIQTTQFEADVRLTQQIEKFYIEGNGGGNGGESYAALWWFALNKTKCDSFQKRGRKGYLFTVGDECTHMTLLRDHLSRFLSASVERDVDVKDLLQKVSSCWHVFHLITPTGTTEAQDAVRHWKQLLGERAIEVPDHHKLGEIIVSTMQVNEGHNLDQVCNSWDGSTGMAVRQAVSGLARQQGDITVVNV